MRPRLWEGTACGEYPLDAVGNSSVDGSQHGCFAYAARARNEKGPSIGAFAQFAPRLRNYPLRPDENSCFMASAVNLVLLLRQRLISAVVLRQ